MGQVGLMTASEYWAETGKGDWIHSKYANHLPYSAGLFQPSEKQRKELEDTWNRVFDIAGSAVSSELSENELGTKELSSPCSKANGHPPAPNPLHIHDQTGSAMMPGQLGGSPHPHYGPLPPHSAGPTPTPGSYCYGYDDSQQRRKPVRAAQACDSCRMRKAKCDEGRPECQHCKENGLNCSYREIPPRKSEKQVLAITERLKDLSENINHLIASQRVQEDHQKAQDAKIQSIFLELMDLQSSGEANLKNDRMKRFEQDAQQPGPKLPQPSGLGYSMPERLHVALDNPKSSSRDNSPYLMSWKTDYLGSQLSHMQNRGWKTVSPEKLLLDEDDLDDQNQTPLFPEGAPVGRNYKVGDEALLDVSKDPVHVHPYRCHKPECESLTGWHYLGGFLRHQREVHGMFASGAKAGRGRKVLPMYFKMGSTEQLLATVPDTGSDENALDWETFKNSGLQLIGGRHARKEFTLANGKSFKSIGQVEIYCCFPYDFKTRCTDDSHFRGWSKVRFNVFSRLAAPIIMGREFLDQTETMTVNQHRLQIRDDCDDNILRVMHFNRPSRRIQCSVDGRSLFANADTGAEMNLVSPSFVAKSGRRRQGLAKEDLQVMLADGSVERITASFEGNLSINGYQGRSDVLTKFFVLPGLTSDALIGEDTLDKVDAFRKHFDAFVDTIGEDDQIGLNIIKWLTGRESKLVRAFSRGSLTVGSVYTASNSLPDVALSPKVFRSTLAEADARELHRREQADRRIACFSGAERATAIDVEIARATAYDDARTRCLTLHQRRLHAQQTLLH